MIPAKKAPSQASPRRRPTAAKRPNWDLLANELGVAPTPVSPPTASPAAGAAPPALESAPFEAVAREPQEIPSEARPLGKEPPRGIAEESPNFFDERFDFSEPFDVLEPGEAAPPSTAPKEPGESMAEAGRSEEGRTRRRRRRRRSRESEPRQPRPSAAPAPGESAELAGPAESGADLLAVTEEFESAARGESADEEDEKAERRGKRHRPHRRRRDRDIEGEASAHGQFAEHGAEAATDSGEEDEGAEDFESGEHEDEEGEEGRMARIGFRKIPAWEEVVGMLITKNLESRAKRPNGGPRGRGGPRNHRGGGRR